MYLSLSCNISRARVWRFLFGNLLLRNPGWRNTWISISKLRTSGTTLLGWLCFLERFDPAVPSRLLWSSALWSKVEWFMFESVTSLLLHLLLLHTLLFTLSFTMLAKCFLKIASHRAHFSSVSWCCPWWRLITSPVPNASPQWGHRAIEQPPSSLCSVATCSCRALAPRGVEKSQLSA